VANSELALTETIDIATAMTYGYLMQTVIETPEYLRRLKSARITEVERVSIVEYVARHPDAGEEIPGTGGARKDGQRL
jgi:hypothetical protein